MERPVEFWDDMAERYAAKPVDDPESYEATLERTRSYLGPTDHVLELGGGTGSTAIRLAPEVAHYTLTDGAGEMMRIAKGKISESGVGNITVRQARTGDPSLPGGVDVVLAFNLLHLIRDVPRACQQIAGQVRPGGYFISKTVTFEGPSQFLRLPLWVAQKLGKAPFIRFMTPQGLERMVRSAGFEIISCEMLPRGGKSCLIVARRR